MATPLCEEPTIVYPEKEFEMALRLAVHSIGESKVPCAIVPGAGFDIAVQVLSSELRTVQVEVKSYGGQRRGGIGFGNGKGSGPQVDLLIDAECASLRDQDVRWAFADATRQHGSARYALLTCSDARAVAMGGVARSKQNNFSLAALREHWITWHAFWDRLMDFLTKVSESSSQS